MKPTSEDSRNEPSQTPPWPSVLKIVGEEFQQSVAVAQLAVQLCQLEMAKSTVPIEKQKLDPEKFVAEAWKVIECARKHVLRSQTAAEYLAAGGDTREALERTVGRALREPLVPFHKLCDLKRHKGDTETICGMRWKVYTSVRGFNDLFWDYWREVGETWKEANRKKEKVALHSESERMKFATLAHDSVAWKEHGELLLDSWKRDGVSPSYFLALARFRRERDNRAANLKRPKSKRKASKR